jgi:hypothetical protein
MQIKLRKSLQAALFACLLTLTTFPLFAYTPVVYTRVEEMTGWKTCGSCGDIGGAGALASYGMIRGITFPTIDGSSSEFYISGPRYANGYWYLPHAPVNTGLGYLRYEFNLYVPLASANAPQAIEFECQQRINGWVYNFAWQADYAANQWRIFNYVLKRWDYSGIPLQRFAPGTWHHIIAEYHNSLSAHAVYHDALTVDGVRYGVNKTHPAKYTGNWSNQFTNAVQLDLNGSGTAYKIFVDAMQITIN